MNLVLDFGNTRIKAAVFNGNEALEQFTSNNQNELFLAIKQLNGIKNCIIGSVTGPQEEVVKHLSTQFKVMLFTSTTPLPLKNLYKSALTLGSDRLAASMGAYSLHPGKNVLTIDAGTCIKYNFVNQKNEYLGGAISPGLNMRLKAMNHYTHALPLAEPDINYDKLTGQSTAESLLSGALIGAACEVDEMINRYRLVYPDLVVMLTGGDMTYLCKQVKSRLFASQNLLLTGLNAILNYNIEK